MPGQFKPLTAREQDLIHEMHARGVPILEIASAVSRNDKTVRKVIGITEPRGRRCTPMMRELLDELRQFIDANNYKHPCRPDWCITYNNCATYLGLRNSGTVAHWFSGSRVMPHRYMAPIREWIAIKQKMLVENPHPPKKSVKPRVGKKGSRAAVAQVAVAYMRLHSIKFLCGSDHRHLLAIGAQAGFPGMTSLQVLTQIRQYAGLYRKMIWGNAPRMVSSFWLPEFRQEADAAGAGKPRPKQGFQSGNRLWDNEDSKRTRYPAHAGAARLHRVERWLMKLDAARTGC